LAVREMSNVQTTKNTKEKELMPTDYETSSGNNAKSFFPQHISFLATAPGFH
jgi:hypothetical protein